MEADGTRQHVKLLSDLDYELCSCVKQHKQINSRSGNAEILERFFPTQLFGGCVFQSGIWSIWNCRSALRAIPCFQPVHMSLQVKNLNKLPTGNANSDSGTVLSQLPLCTAHQENVPRLQEVVLTSGNHGLLGDTGSALLEKAWSAREKNQKAIEKWECL